MTLDESNTVETEYGDYIPLHLRMPKFLEAFPLEDGFAVQIEVCDPLSLKPGLLSLYKCCIENGASLDDFGLPRVPVGPEIVFTAKLVKDGIVLNSASCLRVVEHEHDYSLAETASRQRLLAACGFPGHPSELEDRVAINSGQPVNLGESESDASSLLHEEPIEPENQDESDNEQSVVVPTQLAPSSASNEPSALPPAIQNQLDALCATLDQTGENYTRPSSKKEALKFIREHRAGVGAAS